MKYLFSLVIGIVVFILCFSGAGDIINWMVSWCDIYLLRLFFKVLLWVVLFGTILKASYIGGVVASAFVVSVLEFFDRR